MVFCLVFLSEYSQAQFIRFKRFSLKEGLPHKTVFRVLQQDITGIIWFGTGYGLCRYDGYEFINFSFQDTVSSNSVLSVIELNRDSLLVSFYREGVFIFTNGRLLPLKIGPEREDKVVQLIKTNKNTIYAYAKGGNLYSYNNGELKKITHTLPGSMIKNIGYSPYRGLLIGTDSGLYVLEKKTLIKHPSELLKNRRIDFIRLGKDNIVWVASNEKVFTIKGNSTSLHWDSIGNCQHSILYIDSRGYIWRASPEQGLLVKTDKGTKKFNPILGIKNEIINCIVEDKEGNIWVGTQTNGVFCISIPENTQTFGTKEQDKLPYSTAVLAQENTSWVASQGQLFKIKDSKVIPIKDSFLSNSSIVYNLFQDRDNRLLAATSKGIFIYDTKKNTSSVIRNEFSGAIDFCYTKNNKLLVSSFKSLFYLNDTFLKEYNVKGLDIRINTLLTDDKGDLWLGGEKELYKISNNKVYNIKKNLKVFDLLLDNDGNIWAATNKGVLKLDKKGKETAYTTKKGLSHNLCTSLDIDNKGKVWVATLKGLNYFETSKNSFFPFDIQPFEEMNEILSFSISGDNLLLGTVSNTYQLKLVVPGHKPGVAISKLITDDSTYYSPTKLQLPYKDNSLSVYYSSVAIAYSQQLRYETRLIPIDTGWKTTHQHSITYNNLPSGNYTFMVRVKNQSNGEVSGTESFTFSVHTPFWKTLWFIVVVAATIALLAIFAHRERLKRIRRRDLKKSEIEKQLLYLKMQAMNALMNPHFISNVLHSIIGYLEQLKPGETVNDKYIVYFSELIRLNLINSDKSYISLKDELKRIELYILLEQFRFKNKFEYKITIDPAIDDANIEIPNMIVQPFVENAINHGLLPAKEKGYLNVTIKEINTDTIEIVITDNGVGYNPTQDLKAKNQHRSMGITLVKERMEAANQTHPILIENISNSNHSTKGTKVSITLEV